MLHDDPIISYAEKNGFAPWNVPKEPRCPVCGSDCETVYKDELGNILGCDECLTAYDAFEEEKCFSEGGMNEQI